MADVKISGLPASTTPLAGTEVLPVVQSGVTKQVSVNNLTAGKAVSAAALALSDVATQLTMSRYSTNVPGPLVSLRKYRGTEASPTTIAVGDQLGALGFSGYGGTTLSNGAFIAVNCVAYTSDTDWSTRMGFITRPAGAGAAIVERMRIHASGGISIGNLTDPGATNLSVAGLVGTGGYTVATLPAAGTAGRRAYVTDATLPTYLGVLVGGGAVVCPVFDNGTAWVSA
jgi:hypothetical protein